MQLIERFFLNIKKKQPNDNDTIASTTSTVNKKKKQFSFKTFCRQKKQQQANKEEQAKGEQVITTVATENQELLTQCIETALFLSSPTPRNKRWSTVDTTSVCFDDMRPAQQPRQRKLSLPPQYSNIGYLASIPEVDSFNEQQQ